MTDTPTSKAERNKAARSKAGKSSSSNIKQNRKNLTPEDLARESSRKKKPQLKNSQWAEMAAWWESGEVTLKELSAKFGVHESTISRYMDLNGHIKGSKAEEFAEEIRQRIADELAGDVIETVKRVKQIKEDYLRRMDMVSRLVEKEISNAINSKLPMQTALHNVRAIGEMTKVFATARSETYLLLGVRELEEKAMADDIPELLISELTSNDIERIHMEQAKADGMIGAIDMPSIESDDDVIEGEIIEGEDG